jgi:hypothetical protein
MVNVTDVAVVDILDAPPGLKVQVDSLGRPEQVYVTGTVVNELTMNPVKLVTVRFTGLDVAPCDTCSVPVPRLDVSEKV